MSRYRVAVDVGGTFTDLIVHDEESGRVAIAKTASIPADPAAAIMAALEQASIAPQRHGLLRSWFAWVAGYGVARAGLRMACGRRGEPAMGVMPTVLIP